LMTTQARSSAVITGLRHSHDLGNRACSLSLQQNAHQGINRATRHYAEPLPFDTDAFRGPGPRRTGRNCSLAGSAGVWAWLPPGVGVGAVNRAMRGGMDAQESASNGPR